MQGANPIITLDLEDDRLTLGRKIGATHTFNTAKVDPIAAVMGLTGGQGADMVVEAVGTEKTYNWCPPLLRTGGHITLFGIPKQIPTPFDFMALIRKDPIIFSHRTRVSGMRTSPSPAISSRPARCTCGRCFPTGSP